MKTLLAAAIAVVALLALPLRADATSPARVDAAAAMAGEVGHNGLHGPAPDRALVLGAWHHAGVDTRGLGTPAELLQACTPLDPSAPRPSGPAPADYALYRDATGLERVGMFLSQLDVAVVDQGSVVVVPRPELSGDIGELVQAHLVAQRGSLRICRLSATRWPGGKDDTGITPGRIALADPRQAADDLRWAAGHPRDADTSFLHPIQRILAALAQGITVVWDAVQALFDAIRAVLQWLGPAGAPGLFVLGLLGRTFDGRLLHTVLTAIVVAVLALMLGWAAIALPFAWIAAGAALAATAASAAGVPVLGAIGGAMVGGVFAVASFLVGTLTGIDGSSRVCIGTVLFAVVADVLWLRPALAAAGAAHRLNGLASLTHVLAPLERLPLVQRIAGEGRSLLDIAATAGDALSLRPPAVMQSLRTARDGATLAHAAVTGAPRASAVVAARPVHGAVSAVDALSAGGRRGLDLLSLAWRPSSVSSDLVGHVADGVQLLDAELRAGLPSLPRLRAALSALDPARREAVIEAANSVSSQVVPPLRITARLSHLHSGARTVAGLAINQPPHPSWTRLARSPIGWRRLRGLPPVAPR
ncbi:MAG TPA: hypothetical protein VGQ42_06620 [Candidatus Dormibacteraeota bacterium]|jgi:hypothetical protein|nr:hypothetical protein [Candidatus Dormibacteraeota bacterium]